MKQAVSESRRRGFKKPRLPATGIDPVCTVAAAGLAVLLHSVLPAQASDRCHKETIDNLEELPLAQGDVKSLRIIERINIADDFGPDIFGVDAWVRLHSCSGFLVLNMTKACFLKQAYTRGDCKVQGLPNY